MILDEDFRLKATSMMCTIISVFCLNIEHGRKRERTHRRAREFPFNDEEKNGWMHHDFQHFNGSFMLVPIS